MTRSRITVTNRGISATGGAAQALFDALTKPPVPRKTYVDCGECPMVTSGCLDVCAKAAPPHKVQIGPLDV